MKKIFFIFLFIPAVFSLQEITSYSELASDLMRDYYDYECNLSENELNNIKDFIINNFNIINHSFLNISSSYCYDYGNHYPRGASGRSKSLIPKPLQSDFACRSTRRCSIAMCLINWFRNYWFPKYWFRKYTILSTTTVQHLLQP